MNNSFQIARKQEDKLLKQIYVFFFFTIVCAIFKNRNNFSLAMLVIVNAIFFSVFHILTMVRNIKNTPLFPNYFKLNTGLCVYDLVCCFCICLFDSTGLSHRFVSDPMGTVYLVACFASIIFNAVLIYLFYRYEQVKKRIVQLKERLH